TYHHWHVFANGPSGVSIVFHRSELLTAMETRRGVRTGAVHYMKIDEMRDKTHLAIKELPFLKRWPFGDEDEFRIIYGSSTKTLSSLDIDIPLSCIERIVLSPWLPKSLATPLRTTLKSIDGCQD